MKVTVFDEGVALFTVKVCREDFPSTKANLQKHFGRGVVIIGQDNFTDKPPEAVYKARPKWTGIGAVMTRLECAIQSERRGESGLADLIAGRDELQAVINDLQAVNSGRK